MKLSEKIISKRKELGFTILKLSTLSGIDQALLSKYENNQRLPSETHIKSLSEALHIDYQEIRKMFLAEKIFALLEYEINPMEILHAAEDRVEYLTSKNVFQLPTLTTSVVNKLKRAEELKTLVSEKAIEPNSITENERVFFNQIHL